jgi:hypothetical protein
MSENIGAVLASGSNQQFHAGVNRSLKIRQSVAVLLNLSAYRFVTATWIAVQDDRSTFRRAWGAGGATSRHPDHNVVGVVVGVNSPHLPAIDRKMLRNARREKRYCPFS